MQIRISYYTKLLLVAVMVLGSFVVYTPTAVQAANDSHIMPMDAGDSEGVMGCYTQDCAQQHDNCQEYCLSQSTNQTAAAVLTVQDTQTVVGSLERTVRIYSFSQAAVFITASNRAPPSQKLLRSVMKRE